MTGSTWRVAVCVKATPAPGDVADRALAGQLRLDDSGLGLRLDHIPVGVHGFDEQALGLVAEIGRVDADCEAVVLSVDPAAPAAVFGRVFELGLDDGYQVDSGGTATGPAEVARLLAAAVRHVGADLVVLGDASADEASGVLGGMVAALLDRPCIAGASDLDAGADAVVVTRRRADGGIEQVTASLPAVVTIRSDSWEPTRPRAADVLAARDRTPTVLTPADLADADAGGDDADDVAVVERVGLRVDELARTCEYVTGSPAEVAAALTVRLRAGVGAAATANGHAGAADAALPDGVTVFPDTPEGRAAAGAAAVADRVPVITGAEAVDRSGVALVVSRRIHDGAVVERLRVTGPVVVTAAPGANPALASAVTAVAGADTDRRLTVAPVAPADGAALDDARVVVAVGAGVGTDDTFALVRQLADRLGAAVGGSKVAVDRGWVGPGQKVGLTGTTVAPDVYLALGISGASQHMAGCARAGTIVAVNADPRAPIFRYAKVGVVGDAAQVLAALLEDGSTP